MVQYVDIDYYEDTYEGTAIPEDSFNKYAIKASTHMKRFTFGRIDENDAPECVKYACCEMCEFIYQHDQAQIGGKMVKSETNDGYSVTFAEQDVQADALSHKLYGIALLYLADTDLLNMGVW